MPQPNAWQVSINTAGNPDPNPLGTASAPVHAGDTVTWKNDSGFDITSFTPPTCLAPGSIMPTMPIANGVSWGPYHIAGNPRTNYNYEYFWAGDRAKSPRNGTIDVS